MSLRDDLKNIGVGEAEKAIDGVLRRAREHPQNSQEMALILGKEYEGLLAIIVRYVGNVAETTGASPDNVIEENREFLGGMATALYVVKEVAENRDLPSFDVPRADL